MTVLTIKHSTFNRAPKRRSTFAAVALPAAVVTGGLFLSMQALIEVDDFAPPEPLRYTIDPFLPVPEVAEERPPQVKPIRIEELSPPPSVDPLVKTVENIVLPTEGYAGALPDQYVEPDVHQVKPISMQSVMIRDLQPLTPPTAIYPPRALTQGIQGTCDVFLSVSPKGEPFDVSADCSHPVFKRAAEKAVKKSRFAPKIKHGRALTVTGVVYPIEFKMKP